MQPLDFYRYGFGLNLLQCSFTYGFIMRHKVGEERHIIELALYNLRDKKISSLVFI